MLNSDLVANCGAEGAKYKAPQILRVGGNKFVDLRPACRAHDKCYDDCRNKPTKIKCDQDFKLDLEVQCDKGRFDNYYSKRCYRLILWPYSLVLHYGEVPFIRARKKGGCY